MIPKGKDPEKVKSQPIYYGVSLFSDYNQLKNLFKLPKPTKRLARGHVNQEGGPMRLTDETSHVTWWLYEGVEDFLKNDFVIQEQENKYEQRSHFMFYNKRT